MDETPPHLLSYNHYLLMSKRLIEDSVFLSFNALLYGLS